MKQKIFQFLISIFMLLNFTIVCFAAEKPTVAFKQPLIADSVSEVSRKHLNTDKLLAEMESSFLATRKFNVVTRSKGSLAAIREEQQFADTDLSAGNAAESGQISNADYLIIPEIHQFSFYTTTNKVPNLQNKYFRKDHGVLELNVQILDTITGQITATFTLKDSFSTGESMVSGSGGVPDKNRFSNLAKKVSAQMADQFIALVFPVEIINIKEDQVFLNRGQDGGLKRGDILNVYTKGEVLVDPHTGEQLGTAEEFIGKIKISRVNPKFTIATFVNDNSKGKITVGCVVRKP